MVFAVRGLIYAEPEGGMLSPTLLIYRRVDGVHTLYYDLSLATNLCNLKRLLNMYRSRDLLASGSWGSMSARLLLITALHVKLIWLKL